jgi:hypothetical protein
LAYVLRHKNSFEVFATTFKNSYDLPYYGVKFWETEDIALDESAELLSADWELINIPEAKHKIINVKLNNDPNIRVQIDNDGRVSKL